MTQKTREKYEKILSYLESTDKEMNNLGLILVKEEGFPELKSFINVKNFTTEDWLRARLFSGIIRKLLGIDKPDSMFEMYERFIEYGYKENKPISRKL